MDNSGFREIKPMLRGHQLIGDSLLLRFAEQLLSERCRYENGERRLGLCVSGQTLKDLMIKLHDKKYPVSKNVILLIGTNDMLKKTGELHMKKRMVAILKMLVKENGSNVIILTLPPVPKLASSREHWKRLKNFNDFIKNLGSGSTVRVADITSLYLIGPKTCKLEFFEKYFHTRRRLDLIHLNFRGLLAIDRFLSNNRFISKQSEDSSHNLSDTLL